MVLSRVTCCWTRSQDTTRAKGVADRTLTVIGLLASRNRTIVVRFIGLFRYVGSNTSRHGTAREDVSLNTKATCGFPQVAMMRRARGSNPQPHYWGTTFPVQQGRPVGVPSMFRQRKTSGKPPFPQAAVGVPSAAVRRSLQQSVQHGLLCDKYGGQPRNVTADPLGPHPSRKMSQPPTPHARVGSVSINRRTHSIFEVHNGQSASMAGWGFSTSRQHPTIGETGVKHLAQTVFLVVRSRRHRMDGRGAQYIPLRENEREKSCPTL